jgi:hypothetical protein
MVKKIEAIIPSFKLDAVRTSLNRHNLSDFVVTRVDVDEPDEVPDEPRWSSYSVDAFSPRLKLELAVGAIASLPLLLTADVCLAGLALSVQRIELLLEPFFGGLAGIDRAAQCLFITRLH